jgi:PilZ domain
MLSDIFQGIASLFRTQLSTDERRENVRVRCRYAAYCVDRKTSTEVTVTDICARGFRISGPKKYKLGELVYLVYRGVVGERLSRIPHDKLVTVPDGVRCRVIWCRRLPEGVEVGLDIYDSDDLLSRSWVPKILDKLGLKRNGIVQKRKQIRAPARLDAEVRLGENAVTGNVLNLGVGGALFQTKKHLPVGQGVQLVIRGSKRLPTLRVEGEVVSHRFDVGSDSGMHGVCFRAIDDDTLALLTRYVVKLLKEAGSTE